MIWPRLYQTKNVVSAKDTGVSPTTLKRKGKIQPGHPGGSPLILLWLVVLATTATTTLAFSDCACRVARRRHDGVPVTANHPQWNNLAGKMHPRSRIAIRTSRNPPILWHSSTLSKRPGLVWKTRHANLLEPIRSSSSSSTSKLHSCCCDTAMDLLHHDSNPHHDDTPTHVTQQPAQAHAPRLGRMAIVSLAFWCVSLLTGMQPNHWWVSSHKHVHVGSGLLSWTLALPVLLSKVRTALVVRRRLDASCLMLAASLGAIGLGDYAEAAAVASLFAVSEALEGRAAFQSRQALVDVANDLGPGSARLVLKGTNDDNDNDPVESTSSSHDGSHNDSTDTYNFTTTRMVPADQVPVGSHVSVLVGEKIPCDGQVIQGRSHVDESTLTGEARPQRRSPGDAVLAGAINVGPQVVGVQTTALSSACAVARLAQLVHDARRQPSPLETLVDRFASWYVPPVFGTVLLLSTVPWILYGPTVGRVWAKRGLVTLVAACPCPLVISTPITYVSGLTHAARQGIIVKGGAVLEALGKVQTIAMDKTGTLTRGEFSLQQFKVTAKGNNNVTQRKEVLEHLALVESLSSHPIATAVTKFVLQKEKIVFPPNVSVSEHKILEGEGVVATIQGKAVHIGNKRLFERLGLYDQLSSEERKLADDWANSGATVSFMSMEGMGIVCCFSVADGLRPEAPHVVDQLQTDFGMEVCMLTGDLRENAVAIGRQVTLPPEQIYSNLFPEDKLDIVTKLKKKTSSKGGKVLMCGDGVNDAPALATADVGVAMGSGACLATQTSDVTLMNPIDLQKLVTVLQLGRRVRRILIQNFSTSLFAKAAVVALAAVGGVPSLWTAIASDVVTMLLVTANGLRLLPSSDAAQKKSSDR